MAGCASFANLDCNIKAGIEILTTTYSSDARVRRGFTYCGNNVFYSGWKAALRLYNGPGCAIGADLNFVENVLNQRI